MIPSATNQEVSHGHAAPDVTSPQHPIDRWSAQPCYPSNLGDWLARPSHLVNGDQLIVSDLPSPALFAATPRSFLCDELPSVRLEPVPPLISVSYSATDARMRACSRPAGESSENPYFKLTRSTFRSRSSSNSWHSPLVVLPSRSSRQTTIRDDLPARRASRSFSIPGLVLEPLNWLVVAGNPSLKVRHLASMGLVPMRYSNVDSGDLRHGLFSR